ncbi:hypothetical protein [Pseudoalteromonas luteoviolacea]|uniref:Uncharacterized protein n=1 Tax=Pseudoalteromonas luteoviolacea H33 TaxID=1365251 RepID=A0A162A445_9GAMM|nr:hypothetical protein [Pseudoalteromonas luteoviolacea]KZN45828.1 hypothetical protein N476_25015 [Pseudoalteromonas luteoviolacea H33]KZN76947.1 hypothetical protein N477_13895 [Pseudoalteromonas luteoviolacea H33-S]MBQ4880215.1 hypothetical protein [Pseudoalteromonas luteoviolacea]MBQ4909276.1 hypothetical protein [Pseudoalteromonas luteoviolacea]
MIATGKLNLMAVAILICTLFAPLSWATNATHYFIKDIQVERSFVIVSFYGYKYGRPACGGNESGNKYAFNTNTLAGQNLYLSVLNAATNKLPVEFIGTMDCRDYPTVESMTGIKVKQG